MSAGAGAAVVVGLEVGSIAMDVISGVEAKGASREREAQERKELDLAIGEERNIFAANQAIARKELDEMIGAADLSFAASNISGGATAAATRATILTGAETQTGLSARATKAEISQLRRRKLAVSREEEAKRRQADIAVAGSVLGGVATIGGAALAGSEASTRKRRTGK